MWVSEFIFFTFIVSFRPSQPCHFISLHSRCLSCHLSLHYQTSYRTSIDSDSLSTVLPCWRHSYISSLLFIFPSYLCLCHTFISFPWLGCSRTLYYVSTPLDFYPLHLYITPPSPSLPPPVDSSLWSHLFPIRPPASISSLSMAPSTPLPTKSCYSGYWRESVCQTNTEKIPKSTVMVPCVYIIG